MGTIRQPHSASLKMRRSRQTARTLVLIIAISTIWYFFSPWKLVIELRPKSEIPGPAQDLSTTSEIGKSPEKPEETTSKKDTIEQKFGTLEEEFLKSVGRPVSSPKRSRDESIKFIYDIDTANDWLDLVEGHDSHGLMALTKQTQRYIFDKQNPKSCKDQQFLILNHFPGDLYGIGALFQHIADYLSIAIQTNSILLYSHKTPPGQNFIEGGQGADPSCGRSLDCIFQEISGCKTSVELEESEQSIFGGVQGEKLDVNLDVPAYLKKLGSAIPPVFEQALRKVQPDITAEMLKYWWRGQAAGYLMRLNGGAMKELKNMRLGVVGADGERVEQLGLQWDETGEVKNATMPFPLPEGTLNLHVRHGDKGSEMRLVPFNTYVVEAEKFTSLNPLGYWKRAFLSTEDPNVIEQMKSMARVSDFSKSSGNARWTWYWSGIPRINSGPETQLAQFGNRTTLTLKWLLQLVMALECDAFIGTRGSGWNRLIDSLRCVWMASCKQPYLEVGFDNDWQGYGP